MTKICIYGNPILRAKALPIKSIDKNVKMLAAGMLDLMEQKKGVGLAAQQVGETIRIFTMHVPPQYDLDGPNGKRLNPEINGPLVMINPGLLSRQGAQSQEEGCLSVPEIFAPVRRAYEVLVSFLDINGKQKQFNLKGLMARVIQHELDHLDGILFVDRLSTLKKISVSAKLKQLKRAAEQEIAAE